MVCAVLALVPIKTFKMVADYQFLSKNSSFWQKLRNSPLHILAIWWLSKKNVGLFGMAYRGATVGRIFFVFWSPKSDNQWKVLRKTSSDFSLFVPNTIGSHSVYRCICQCIVYRSVYSVKVSAPNWVASPWSVSGWPAWPACGLGTNVAPHCSIRCATRTCAPTVRRIIPP